MAMGADALPDDFWNAERMAEVYSYMKWFIKLNMPWIMWGVAFFLASGVVAIILAIVFRDTGDGGERIDEGYDVHHF